MKKVIFCLCVVSSLLAGPPPVAPTQAPTQAPAQEKAPSLSTPSETEKLYWRYHHLVAIGYRRDREQFHEPDGVARFTDRNAVELVVRSHFEVGRFVSYLQGSYSWLVNGHFSDALKGGFVGEPTRFGTYDLGAGYTADVAMAVGIPCSLLSLKQFKVSFIPFGGYMYSHIMNFVEGEERFAIPSPPKLLAAGTNGFALARFPNPNQQDWFGFYAEGDLQFIFLEDFEWTFFYQYMAPMMRSKLKEEIDLYLYNSAGAVSAVNLFRANAVYEGRVVPKQVIGTNFRFHGRLGYNFGIHFDVARAHSNKVNYLSQRKEERALSSPTTLVLSNINTRGSVKWVTYKASIYLGYQF